MITGFNHNLRLHGILFHVQTEDKGLQNPKVETQVFHQGHVVAVRKSNYEKFVSAPNVRDIVMAMMKEQHKKMMKDLADGRVKAAQELFLDEHEEKTLNAPEPDETEVQETQKEIVEVVEETELESEMKKLSAEKTLDELIIDFLRSDDT